MCFYYNLLIVPYGRKLWQLVQDFHILQPLGFLCIIVGMCFYYNLLIVPYGRKLWQLVQDFHILQPLGFLCIIVGMCFYYNLLIVPYGRKLWQLFQDHQNSKKKINPTSPPPPGTQLPPGEPTEVVVSQKRT